MNESHERFSRSLRPFASESKSGSERERESVIPSTPTPTPTPTLPTYPPRPRVAAVDFDGVLCADSRNIYADFEAGRWQPVMPGAVEGMSWLRKNGYEVVIYTCREYTMRRYLETFLKVNQIPYDYIVFHGKPRADVYIDDKAIRFTNWPDVIAQLAPSSPVAFAAEPNTLFEEALKRERWRHGDVTGVRRMLDIGPGHAPFWPESVGTVDCVEPDFNARARLRENPRTGQMWTGLNPEVAVAEYDLVTCCGVLEHVAQPAALLDQLAAAQRIFLTVPNGASFHRHVGRMLGLLRDFNDLGAADLRVGHQRYYTCDTLATELGELARRTAYALKVTRLGSCGFKFADNLTMAGLLAQPGLVTALNKAAEAVQLTGENCYDGAELYAELTR